MQMAAAQVLLDDVSDFRDSLVTLDLEVGQLSGGEVLAHDAIRNLIGNQKVQVGFTGVALVGIDLFDLLICMTTESGSIGQEVGIVDRSGCKGGGQHKAVVGVHRRMFLQPKVRGIIFDHPVGLKIAGELQRLAVFIMLPLFGLAVFALFFELIVAHGPAGGLDQAGIHGHAFIDAINPANKYIQVGSNLI